MKSIKFTIISILVLMVFLTAVFPAGAALAQGDRTATVIPTLKAPLNTIVTKTPTYTWTKVANATRYQYQVYLGTVKKWDKEVAASACGSSTCAIKPALTLGYNKYKWRVRAMIANTWYDWSAYVFFSVSAPSFYSGFDGSMTGWAKMGTIPWLIYISEMYSNGVSTKYSSVYRTTGKYTDFDYSVRLKRNGAANGSNNICFRMGSSLSSTNENWYPGYTFGYTDQDSSISLAWYDDSGLGHSIYTEPFLTALNPNDWNVLRVVAYGNVLNLFVNDTLVTAIIDDHYQRGYVGVDMYASDSDATSVSVDWVKLTVLGKLADYETALSTR